MRHYADPGFIRSFGFYFISDRLVGDVLDEDRFVGSKRIFWDEYYAMTAKLEGSTEVSEIHRLVRFIESSGFIHQDRFQGYLKLKENFGDEGILNCFAALFDISSYQILSWPAEKILYDHYSEIVCEVGSNYTHDFFSTKERLIELEDHVLETLGKYILKYCKTEDVTVWGDDNYQDVENEPSDADIEEYRPMEEYEKLNCYVHFTDDHTAKRVSTARYIAACRTTDFDYGVQLIGNLITFASKKSFKETITFQITGHQCFDTCDEMYRELGTEAFGYSDGMLKERANKTASVLEEFQPEGTGVLALKVRRLDIPILTRNDFSKCKEMYSNWEIT